MNNADLRTLKFQNVYSFHRAALKFHSDAMGMTASLKKQLTKKVGK
jgi:hypothetical protein